MSWFEIPAKKIPVSHETDVVVVGGGPAGIAAAIAAARNGAKTLLIEQRGFLGGMATVSLVPAFCPYSDKEKAVIRGIGLELMENMKQLSSEAYRAEYADVLDWVPIDAEVLKRVYDEAILSSGVDVLFHTFAYDVDIDSESKHIRGIQVVNKSGNSYIRCRYVIDATGDADIAALADVPFHKGGDDGVLQPGTMCYSLTQVDRKKFFDYLEKTGDTPQIPQAVAQAQENGDLPPGRKDVSGFAWVSDSMVGVNFGHVFGIDGTNAEDLTRAAIEGRKLVEIQARFLRNYVPGFEQAHVTMTGEQIGIRETRRIVGDYVLVQEDFEEMKSFEDDIARNAYFIDIHMASSKDKMQIKRLPPGKSHGVPYRCMLPKGIENLWVPGRAASSDRVVQGSLRVMPNCFAMGQAAGTASALAIEYSLSSTRQVDIAELQKKLMEQGAWLGEELHAKHEHTSISK